MTTGTSKRALLSEFIPFANFELLRMPQCDGEGERWRHVWRHVADAYRTGSPHTSGQFQEVTTDHLGP